MTFRRFFYITLFVCLTIVLAGCGGSTSGGGDDDGSSGGDDDSGGSTSEVANVTVRAGGNTLAVGDQTTVRATLEDDAGENLGGIPVEFTASNGQLSDDTVTTDPDGIARVTLKAPDTTGTAQIAAIAQGVPGSISVQFVAGPVSNLQLDASPTTVAFNRSTSLTIRAEDNSGNPVADQSIRLQTVRNTSQGSFDEIDVTTDENGRATAVYTAGNADAGTDTLRARTGSVNADPVDITVDPNAARLEQLTLRAGSDSITADSESETFIRAALTDTQARPVQGVEVAFQTNEGSLSSETATTDASGIAEIELTASTRTTTAQVLASVGGLNQSAPVDFVAGPVSVANSSITANPSSLPAGNEGTTELAVTLADANANPVADGTEVRLQSSAGRFQSANPTSTTLGRATFTLQAPADPATARVNVLDQPGLATTVRFGAASSGEPASIQVDAEPQSITVASVGQEERSTISLDIKDNSGDLIDESAYDDADLNNVRVTLVTRPNGGEFLAGTDANGDSVTSADEKAVDVRSNDGRVTLNLQSGTRPGVVEARVQVLAFDGSDFTNSADVATTASLPQISIASGPPNTLVFTSPESAAITDEGGGVYSRLGTVIVTDKFGNAVPDGTAVSLGLIDSVSAKGTGTTSEDNATLTADNFDFDTRCTTPFDCQSAPFNFTSTIIRNDVARRLQAGDRILIQNAEAEDKGRFIAVGTTGNATTVGAQTPYRNDTQDVRFAVGASLLGGEIAGEDEDGDLQTGTGATVDGRIPFRVSYPANRNTILAGCYGSDLDGVYTRDDKRFAVPQSAQVYVVASSSDTNATGIDRNQFCFGAIADATLEASPQQITGDATVNLTLEDGGDGIRLPFVPVSATYTVTSRGESSQFAIGSVEVHGNAENSKQQTNINGQASATIDINCDDGAACESGDSAIVTFRAADASVEVDVTIL